VAKGKAYKPFAPVRRPGGKPDAKPSYRVLVHGSLLDEWHRLPDVVGMASAQQFYDHVAQTPGRPPAINRSTILRGKAGAPKHPGFSRTVHYEISGAGRVDYQYCDNYLAHGGDSHRVVFVMGIDLGSH
jgi:hypothetical protein